MLPLWTFLFPTESILSLDPDSWHFLVSGGISVVVSCGFTLQCACLLCNLPFFEAGSLPSLTRFLFPIIMSLSEYKTKLRQNLEVNSEGSHIIDHELACTQISHNKTRKQESAYNIINGAFNNYKYPTMC